MRQSAPRLKRLTKRAQFQAAAGNGRRFRSPAMTVQVLDRDDGASGVRVGLTASRHVGGAVERNRIRRRLRAAAREAFTSELRPVDVVLVARREALSANYSALVRTAQDAITRAKPQTEKTNRSKADRTGAGNDDQAATLRPT